MADVYERDPLVRTIATGLLAIAIAGVGAVMMGVTSSPAMKGAALLWLPAALQLIAGVWLGPGRGFIAGAVGAQLAGIIAYGGWAPSDWIMNFVAGGAANAWLPGLLFRLFAIDPSFPGATGGNRPRVPLVLGLAAAALLLAFGQRLFLAPSAWGYAAPLVIVVVFPLFLGIRFSTRFVLGLAIAILSCAVSAVIGVVGSIVAGQTLEGAIVGVGIGWFLGDAVSAVVGLYALSALTPWARERGIAPVFRTGHAV